MTDYEVMVARKLAAVPPSGIASGFSIPGALFPHQSALTAWALRRKGWEFDQRVVVTSSGSRVAAYKVRKAAVNA